MSGLFPSYEEISDPEPGLDGRLREVSPRIVCMFYLLTSSDRLEQLSARRARETHSRFRPCLSSKCSGGQVHWSYKNPVVTCQDCGSRSCFNHRIPWHDGYSCDGYDDSHPAAKSTRTSEQRLKTMAKKCPGKGCSFYVQKDGGCPSMYCTQCNQSWDWSKVPFEKTADSIYEIAK